MRIFGLLFILCLWSCGSPSHSDEMEEIYPNYIVRRAYGNVRYLIYSEKSESPPPPSEIIPILIKDYSVADGVISIRGWLYEPSAASDGGIRLVVRRYADIKINVVDRNIEVNYMSGGGGIENYDILNNSIVFDPYDRFELVPEMVMPGFSITSQSE